MPGQSYENFLANRHLIYNALPREILCQALGETVRLNKHGWDHFSRDGFGIPREAEEILTRLALIEFIPIIIGEAFSYGVQDRNISERKVVKDSTFYELAGEAVLHQKTIPVEVIVHQIGVREPYFLSIYHKKEYQRPARRRWRRSHGHAQHR